MTPERRKAPVRRLVLASTSPFRSELLQRIGVPFDTMAPNVDETLPADEPPAAGVRRLAEAKAGAVAAAAGDALIIGADLVGVVDGVVIGKPGSHERAREQLRRLRGRRVIFHSGLCLLDSRDGRRWVDCVDTGVLFRLLTDEEIERYLLAERPYQCAGSFMSERLGISVVDAIDTADPTALIGLPLIRLCAMLREAGLPVP